MLLTRRHRVLTETPHPKSFAASVLLRHRLSEGERSEWMVFRDGFLDRHGLKCFYCGQEGLTKEVGVGGLRLLATIDHVQPRSKGGAEYDETNLRVACFPCNKAKSDKTLQEWKHEQESVVPSSTSKTP